MHPCFLPYVLHAPPISVSLISWPEYLWRNTDHDAPRYVVFSTPVTSFLLSPNISLSTLFSNTLSLCSSLSATDQVSHPYTTGRITAMYILTFILSGGNVNIQMILCRMVGNIIRAQYRTLLDNLNQLILFLTLYRVILSLEAPNYCL